MSKVWTNKQNSNGTPLLSAGQDMETEVFRILILVFSLSYVASYTNAFVC